MVTMATPAQDPALHVQHETMASLSRVLESKDRRLLQRWRRPSRARVRVRSAANGSRSRPAIVQRLRSGAGASEREVERSDDRRRRADLTGEGGVCSLALSGSPGPGEGMRSWVIVLLLEGEVENY